VIRAWTFAALSIPIVLAGCSAEPIVVPTRSFYHPGDIALVCFDLDAGRAVPLARCATGATDGVALHALVTQTSRGEVAAVDLTARRLLDSDPRVPGYTFVAVGELPADIVVPATDPSFTFVADLGSRDLLAVPTESFRPELGTVTGPSVRLPLPSAPADLALSPDESALFVALPESGAVARVTLDDAAPGRLGALELFPLGTDVPPGVAAEPEADYCKACRPSGPGCEGLLDGYPRDGDGLPVALPPRDAVTAGTSPQPVALAVDAEQGRLLVADRALPVIHVVDLLSPSTPLAPLVVGVPTEDVVVTPRVPAGVDASGADARYVYAIDALDRSVLAVDYDTGAVLPVSAPGGDAVDRIRLPAGANTLAVATPGFPGAACSLDDADSAGRAAPDVLRGVFLMVGTIDGFLQVIDVYDLDASCRGGDAECRNPPDADDAQIFVRRHRPRIGVTVTTGTTLVADPAIIVNDVSYRVGIDGMTDNPASPSLLPLEGGCATSQEVLFPTAADGGGPEVLCVLADPWVTVAEQWTASFEGTIPGTAGGRGRLGLSDIGAAPTLFGEVPFCDRGVLGSEDVPADGPEAGHAGDLLVITGDVPPSTADDTACAPLTGEDGTDRPKLDFRILRAYPDRLELEAQSRSAPGIDFDLVRTCYPELTTYQVRTQAAYTVFGTRTGFRHRGAVSSEGRCAVDPGIASDHIGRALPGRVFDNALMRMRLSDFTADPEGGVELRFAVSQIPGKLFVDIGLLPVEILYSPIDGKVYALDSSLQGLLQLSVSPVEVERNFE